MPKKVFWGEETFKGDWLEESLEESGKGLPVRNGRLARAALKVAVQQELTERQRECVEMYYVRRMTMEEIGGELGIGKSTVYKHLQTAKEKVRKGLAYAAAIQEAMEEEDD